MVDARLADGSRVNASFRLWPSTVPAFDSPLCRDPVTARNMIENKSLTEPMLELLSAMVKDG
jgi:Flp pilus assembly CpaF family ATPase